MMDEKGLPEDVADRIGEYVRLNGKTELVDKLLKDERLITSKSAIEGLEAMKLVLKYCDLYETSANVLFDLSLARGLDYYTGIIYEAILLGKNARIYLMFYNIDEVFKTKTITNIRNTYLNQKIHNHIELTFHTKITKMYYLNCVSGT